LNSRNYATFRKRSRRERSHLQNEKLRELEDLRNEEAVTTSLDARTRGLREGLRRWTEETETRFELVTTSLDTRAKSLRGERAGAKKKFREDFEIKTSDTRITCKKTKTLIETKLAEAETQAERGSCGSRRKGVGAAQPPTFDQLTS
jgi:hypothetical protein